MARALVEGLTKAGPNPSAAKLRRALDSTTLDLGGYRLAFTAKNHSGSGFVDVAVLDTDGRMVR